MESTIQSPTHEFHERISKIDDRGAGLGDDVFPFPRVGVHDLQAAELVEEDRDGAEIGVLAKRDGFRGDRRGVGNARLVAACVGDFVQILQCLRRKTELVIEDAEDGEDDGMGG